VGRRHVPTLLPHWPFQSLGGAVTSMYSINIARTQ
jgi:hypothetical protein